MGSTVACGEYAGFEIQIDDDDARMSVTLVHKAVSYPQCYPQTISPHFSTLGEKIEWRYPKGEPLHPVAMIVRVHASMQGDTPHDSKSTSYLAVSKIVTDEICVVGKIPAVKNQNILARKMADRRRRIALSFQR
ncbi:MAG: hypothetical protein Q9M36_15705 [Sulfurovum sp.]|nr:hypothetical protein [Sulfurovum sp.]